LTVFGSGLAKLPNHGALNGQYQTTLQFCKLTRTGHGRWRGVLRFAWCFACACGLTLLFLLLRSQRLFAFGLLNRTSQFCNHIAKAGLIPLETLALKLLIF